MAKLKPATVSGREVRCPRGYFVFLFFFIFIFFFFVIYFFFILLHSKLSEDDGAPNAQNQIKGVDEKLKSWGPAKRFAMITKFWVSVWSR